MVRAPCCSEMGLKKGPWTPEEDQILIDHIQKHGHGSWQTLPKSAGLNRCGKSCRLRWFNYLRPDIKRGNFSEDEERIIIHFHSLLGNKWSRIAVHLPGRTDNEIKNFWNTQLRKKLLQMGIDPKTHKPIPDSNLLVNLSRLLSPSNMINIPIMMNPLVNAHTFQADATNQLAKIQLLHNILQVVNMSRLPKVEQEEEANYSNLARLYGQTSEAVKQSTMDHSSQEWFGFINVDTMESFEGGFKPEEFLHHRDMYGINCIKSTLPGLVSTTSESSIVDQMNDIMTPAYVPTPCLPESNVFEDWEKLVDDEAITSFLKDIVD